MDMNCDGLCLNDINLDNIPRCPNCNLISLLKLNYKEGKELLIIVVKIIIKVIYL